MNAYLKTILTLSFCLWGAVLSTALAGNLPERMFFTQYDSSSNKLDIRETGPQGIINHGSVDLLYQSSFGAHSIKKILILDEATVPTIFVLFRDGRLVRVNDFKDRNNRKAMMPVKSYFADVAQISQESIYALSNSVNQKMYEYRAGDYYFVNTVLLKRRPQLTQEIVHILPISKTKIVLFSSDELMSIAEKDSAQDFVEKDDLSWKSKLSATLPAGRAIEKAIQVLAHESGAWILTRLRDSGSNKAFMQASYFDFNKAKILNTESFLDPAYISGGPILRANGIVSPIEMLDIDASGTLYFRDAHGYYKSISSDGTKPLTLESDELYKLRSRMASSPIHVQHPKFFNISKFRQLMSSILKRKAEKELLTVRVFCNLLNDSGYNVITDSLITTKFDNRILNSYGIDRHYSYFLPISGRENDMFLNSNELADEIEKFNCQSPLLQK